MAGARVTLAEHRPLHGDGLCNFNLQLLHIPIGVDDDMHPFANTAELKVCCFKVGIEATKTYSKVQYAASRLRPAQRPLTVGETKVKNFPVRLCWQVDPDGNGIGITACNLRGPHVVPRQPCHGRIAKEPVLFVVGGKDISDADRLPPRPFGYLQLCQLWRADFRLVKVVHKEGSGDPVDLLALVDPTAVLVECVDSAGLATNGIVKHQATVTVGLQGEGPANACKLQFGDVCTVEAVHGVHLLKL